MLLPVLVGQMQENGKNMVQVIMREEIWTSTHMTPCIEGRQEKCSVSFLRLRNALDTISAARYTTGMQAAQFAFPARNRVTSSPFALSGI